MRKVSPEVRDMVMARKQVCARMHEGGCGGRLTWEHAIIYGGKQLDEAWAIVILCACHHSVDEYQDGGLLDKEKNEWIALNQATDFELMEISKAIDYLDKRARLNEKYGYPLILKTS